MTTVISQVGRVSGRIAPGVVGEVMIRVRGGVEAFLAYAVDPTETIERNERVIVIEQDSERTVRVTKYAYK